jgi:hypothetical protein
MIVVQCEMRSMPATAFLTIVRNFIPHHDIENASH